MLSIITPGNEIDLFLPEGFYSDGYQLADRCNRMIERNLKDAGTVVDTKLAYDADSRKISIHVEAVVTLSSDLAGIVGFSPRHLTFREERKYKGKVAMGTNRGFNSLYFYCDAAEAISVGDIKAPLLRVVDAAGNFDDLIHRLYTTPQYVPVSRKEFKTVEIDMSDDTGRPVPFEFGKVVATLHFRQCRNSYFLSSRENGFAAMLAEHYTKTIIRGKAGERCPPSTVQAHKEVTG